jgi:hypothetical protein
LVLWDLGKARTMKRTSLTILLALLWLIVAIVYQPQSRSYALPFASANGDAVWPSTTAQLTATVGGGPVITDLVAPQIHVWPLDGTLASLDGQAPLQSRGISFVAGRFDRAAEFTRHANSTLAYRAAGNVDANEGSLALWIRPTYDLTNTAYLDHPQVFSYAIDRDNQLSVEIDDGCVTLNQRNQGRLFPGTCQPMPDWRAGEWHHLAVTWSASANRMAVTYDCAQTVTGDYRALSGIADMFYLGSNAAGQTLDAALDDMRLSRRALTVNEVAAVCRDRPLPHDQVPLPSAPLEPAPLGTLQPITGLLPHGTVSFTLSLTTTAPADCRWSEITSTLYVSMPHSFLAGQGSVSHSTPISPLAELDDRRFYVRCQDVSTGRDPDGDERQTHLRVLGPWSNRYPRVANLWNDFTTDPGADFVAGFDLHVVFGGSNQASQAPDIRAANPNAKVLLTTHATYGVPGIDSPATEWWYSQPGDPDYNCLLRNTQGTILLVAYWNHPMYNLTVPYCRTILARLSLDAYLSLDQNWGADLAYDGLYWDRLHDTIDWLGSDLDSDLDGQPDTPDEVNAAYQAGVKDFLTQVRVRLPHAILMGNDAAQVYAPWINGRNFETQVAGLMDGAPITWTGVVQDYRAWASSGITPHTTFIASSPELFYSSKFTYLHTNQMPPAMRAEAAASYSRMRYGLVTALLGDGLFSYDYGPDSHGDRWWYDEYGVPGVSSSTLPPTDTLPPRGYLGQPGNALLRLEGVLHSSDQVINGSFNNGLNNWIGWIDPNSGAAGRFKVSDTGGLGGTAAASIVISETDNADSIELRQLNKSTVENHQYTVSFWGRSTQPAHLIDIQLIVNPTPWVGTGYHVQATLTPQWQLFRLTDVSVRTRNDLRLVFQLGSETGKIWLDDIQFQEGEAGAWARSFENGFAVINPGSVAQTVQLPGVYRKLTGSQAPLFQARLDDNDLLANGSWVKSAASFAQFGSTVYTITAPNPLATITYQPNLLYAGTYQVLAWVVPTATQSSAVDITIYHAAGKTTVKLDETQGEIGWRDLGTYRFGAGTTGRALLSATGAGLVVADAFKWVSTARYNDGQTVSQIDLQPQDAIILQRTHDTFLPLLLR